MSRMIRGSLTVLLAGYISSPLAAQSPAAPPAYSLTELNSLLAPDMTVKIARDGDHEIFLQTRPVSAGSPKGYRGGMYFDFHDHFQYTWDETDGTVRCGRQPYGEATAPALFDVISGVAEMKANMANAKLVPAGHETIAGLSTAVYSLTDSVHHSLMKVWLSDSTNYLLRMSMGTNGAPLSAILDVQALSFDRPPPTAFAVPSSCHQGG